MPSIVAARPCSPTSLGWVPNLAWLDAPWLLGDVGNESECSPSSNVDYMAGDQDDVESVGSMGTHLNLDTPCSTGACSSTGGERPSYALANIPAMIRKEDKDRSILMGEAELVGKLNSLHFQKLEVQRFIAKHRHR